MFCSGLATRHFLHSSLNLAGKWRQTDHRPFLGRRLSLLFHHPHWLLARGTLHRWGENPHAQLISHVQLFATPWNIAHRAPLSTGLSRQEYCSGLPFPSPGDLPDPGIKPKSTASHVLEGGFFTTGKLPGKPQHWHQSLMGGLLALPSADPGSVLEDEASSTQCREIPLRKVLGSSCESD